MEHQTLREFRRLCVNGKFAEASRLLDARKACDKKEYLSGWGTLSITPLHWACIHGDVSFARLLVECGADPEATLLGGHEETPLHLAGVEGHLDVVRYLTKEAGCNPNFRSHGYKRPPITYTCGVSQVATALPHYSDDEKAVEVVKFLYSSCNCDPNWQDDFGMTALHNACINRRLDVVKCLIVECHGNVHLCSNDGSTPLHFVCMSNPYAQSASAGVEIIRYLVEECGCDPDGTNNRGLRPIDISRDPEITDTLISLAIQDDTDGCS